MFEAELNQSGHEEVITSFAALTTQRRLPVPMADEEIPQIVRCFKFRLLPTKAQHKTLERICEDQRQLYNAALTERIDCYRKTGKSISYMDQCKSVTVCRSSLNGMAAIPVNIQRATLKRLDEAFAGFFGRVKASGKAGFPRFKGKGWWSSFGFAEFSGIRFDGKRLRFNGIPQGLCVHLHRSIPPGKFLGCTFKRDTKGWSVSFQVRHDAERLPGTGRKIGLDVGLSSLATTDAGETIPNPKVAKRAEREMRRRQRALSRCKRGSNNRKKAKARVARLHAKIANARSTYLHQVTARLIRENDVIAIEALNVEGLAKGMLAKSVHDVAWTKFRNYLAYKAENAGRTLIEVDPRNTTQACSGCGTIVPKGLSQRRHSCPECGLDMDRDQNAAVNILHRAVLSPGLAQSLATAA